MEVWVEWNPNPCGRRVGDCSVRAIARALDMDWESAYALICAAGFAMCDMPSSDGVWGAVLRQNGFVREAVDNKLPEDYTAEDFCRDHPRGTYVLGFGGHVATVVDGLLYDSWPSAREMIQFYWRKKEDGEDG